MNGVLDAVSAASLLGTPSADFWLRIREGASERVVRLDATRLTIGSGGRCAVQLRQPWAREVECLVLRGAARTIVRCWSPASRLNGRKFTDAVLRPGDVLGVSGAEIEVLDPQTEELTKRAADLSVREAALAAAELEAQSLAGRLRSQRIDLEESLLHDRQAMQAEATRHASDRLQQLEGRLAELEAERARLTEDRRLWEADRQADVELREREALQAQALWADRMADFEKQQAAAMRDLARRDSALVASQQAFEQEQATWRASQEQAAAEAAGEAEAMLAERRELERASQAAEREAFQAEMQGLRQAFEQERSAWRASQEQAAAVAAGQAEAMLAERRELERASQAAEWEAFQAEMQGLRQAFEQEQAAWRASQEQAAAQAAGEAEAMLAERRELERASQAAEREAFQTEMQGLRQAFEQERSAWRASQEQAVAQAAGEAEAMLAERRELEQPSQAAEREAFQAEMQGLRQAFEQERSAWRASQEQAAAVAHADVARGVLTEPDRSGKEPEAERPSWQGEQRGADDAERLESLDGQSVDATDVVEPKFSQVAAESPVSTAELLRRYRTSDETEQPAVDFSARRTIPAGTQTAAPATPVVVRHDEDSIDAYMARLLERVGARPTIASGAAASQGPLPAQDSEPRATYSEPAQTRTPEPAGYTKVSDMVRRPAPPERSADLTAMRELANMNARSALETHYRRSVGASRTGKSVVVLVALACAGFHGWFYLSGVEGALYPGIASLTVAGLWGAQYLMLVRRAFGKAGETFQAQAGSADAQSAATEVQE